MSSLHARGRVPRARLILALTALGALAAGPAFAADNIFPDGDTADNSPNLSYGGTNGNPCAARGQGVAGSILVRYNGNAQDGHFQAGEPVDVDFDPPTGVTVNLTGPAPVVPATWGSSQNDTFSIPFSTTVSPASAGGKVEVTVTGLTSGYAAGASAGGGKPQYQVHVACDSTPPPPTNTTPTVAISTGDTTSNEGSEVGYAFSITDPDAGQTWTAAADCGGGSLTTAAAVDNAAKTGSFGCSFADGPSSHTVSVTVTDSAGASSNTASVTATVLNVAPVVAAPAFAAAAVDCRVAVTLSGISFTDPGLIDNPWKVSIDWGDGSADTEYDTASQGAQPDQSHTYNAPGTYSATITVTDKDSGSGSSTSSNAIKINQAYNTTFLPPFDGSSPAKLIVNQMKSGRTVPVKVTIYDVCTQSYVTAPSVVTVGVKKTDVAGNPTQDAIESYADAGASSGNTNLARWNADATSPTGGFWIYNLDSKALALVVNQTYRVDLYVDTKLATAKTWGVLQPVK